MKPSSQREVTSLSAQVDIYAVKEIITIKLKQFLILNISNNFNVMSSWKERKMFSKKQTIIVPLDWDSHNC